MPNLFQVLSGMLASQKVGGDPPPDEKDLPGLAWQMVRGDYPQEAARANLSLTDLGPGVGGDTNPFTGSIRLNPKALPQGATTEGTLNNLTDALAHELMHVRQGASPQVLWERMRVPYTDQKNEAEAYGEMNRRRALRVDRPLPSER